MNAFRKSSIDDRTTAPDRLADAPGGQAASRGGPAAVGTGRRDATGPDAEPRPQSATDWLLVATREIVVRATNRGFIVSTIVTLVILAGAVGFMSWQGGRESTYQVVVTAADGERIVTAANDQAKAADEKMTIETTKATDDDSARTTVRDGDADVWLHRGTDGWVMTSNEDPPDKLAASLREVVRSTALADNAAAAGTSLPALQQGTVLATDRIDGGEDNSTMVQIAQFIFAMLFYVASLTFGYQIANSVVEEKQSRIVEIIATAIPLRHLLAGKVVGNSVIALGQMVMYVAVGLIGLSFTDLSTLLPQLSGATAWFVVFFLLGFLSLACLWAVAGSLASRTEDLQSTTGPLTIILMLVYFVSFSLEGTARTISSFLPIVSVISMPARILGGDTAWWEPVVALLIMGAFAALTVIVGERAYRRSLMQTHGGKLSWRQALTTPE